MKKLDSKFRLVLIAARRAEQIISGAEPKAKSTHSKPTYIALQEVDQDLISATYNDIKGETVHLGPIEE
jgi:DNA-directed RNA polymerase subunit omega